MLSLKRRDVLILASIWLLGCVVVLVLVGLFLAGRPPAAEEPKPIATFVIPVRGETAKAAYRRALRTAQAWQGDVATVAVSTYWPEASLDRLGEVQAWDVRFFSPGRQRLYFTIVNSGGGVAGRAHLYKLRYAPPLIDPARWLVDSDEALNIWANNGGGAFIHNYPGSRVEAMLRQSPERQGPVWDIIGISAEQSQVFYLAIDAGSGAVLGE